MAPLPQVRGALLEEIVLLLLSRSGYRQVLPGEEGTQPGKAGLEVKGRGSWHQIDAFVAPVHSHAFIYPIRLILEAKCYEERPVDIRTVRALVGTLLDISQNYFSQKIEGLEVQIQRYNYHGALFSASGYSTDAQQYAAAHQVFLIDYTNVPTMLPVIRGLFALNQEDFEGGDQAQLGEIRKSFRQVVRGRDATGGGDSFSNSGKEKLRDTVMPAIDEIGGSYYGMIEGIYPIHLIAKRPISARLIFHDRVIRCRIRVSGDNQTWAFEPSRVDVGSSDYFRLEFQIPMFIAEILNARSRRDEEGEPEWLRIARLKGEMLRYVDVTGIVEEQSMTFRLALDETWLQEYINARRAREAR